MKRLTLDNIGREVEERRGKTGIRAAAKEIGISASTLSRIENGYLPDLETFKKICEWLDVNPGDVLGTKTSTNSNQSNQTSVHFKKDAAVDKKTAEALATMILSAQRALDYQEAGN